MITRINTQSASNCGQVKMDQVSSADSSSSGGEVKVHPKTDSPATNDDERINFLSGLGRREKTRIIKNVVLVSVAFMLHFTAFHGTANLQSSINLEAGVGTYSLLSVYGSLTIANIFLPVLIIRYLGCKWTISLTFITYMPFVAAQFYPSIYTLIPSGLAVGLGGAALWCAKCTYLTILAEAFSGLSKSRVKSEDVVVRFFSIFFFFYQAAQVWGNLISSSVLSIESSSGANSTAAASHSVDVGELCGANFCPGLGAAENNNLLKPDKEKINLLSGIFLACMAGAVLLVAIGVDTAKRYDFGRTGSGSGLTGWGLITVTARHMSNKCQLLLIPVIFFVGFDHAIINADFTASFVACGWGIANIGYAMMCFGIANAVGSLVAGFLTKLIGRYTVVAITAGVHLALLLWLIQWRPVTGGIFYCAIAAVWGCVNGIWLVQINALNGILFPGNEEAAFSNFRFIEALGSMLSFAISPHLCMSVKLWIMIGLILLGMTGYSVVEHQRSNERRRTAPMATVSDMKLDSDIR